MFFSFLLRKPRPHPTPYPPAYPLILTPHLPPFPYLPILPFFLGVHLVSFPFFSLITLLCSPCPAPVYKSRMYTALLLQLRFYVQVSAIRGDFDLFPKDLYIISPRQGRSTAQARLVHRGRPPETTPLDPHPADSPLAAPPVEPSGLTIKSPTPVYKSRMYTVLYLLLRFYVQVSYVHRSVPPVAFLCTRLGDKGRFRPFSERLVHNITTAGTFGCTSQTCTQGPTSRNHTTRTHIPPIPHPTPPYE